MRIDPTGVGLGTKGQLPRLENLQTLVKLDAHRA